LDVADSPDSPERPDGTILTVDEGYILFELARNYCDYKRLLRREANLLERWMTRIEYTQSAAEKHDSDNDAPQEN
jgi:hypothetical protein